MSSVVLAVVGNKGDRSEDRVVSEEEGQKMAEKLGVHLFFESSAKTGMNVDELFTAVAREALSKVANQVKAPSVEQDSIKVSPASKPQTPNQCACGGGSG